MANKKSNGDRLAKLRAALAGHRSLLIVMQSNPDPDSLASAAALRRLANVLEQVQCSIAYGGVIGRAENQALADYLGLNFRTWEEVDPSKFDAIALVDTQPNTGNNALPADVTPDIVLDHHPLRPESKAVPFTDIRPRYGAVSTMLYEYLMEAEITPDARLATALIYAIRTDTQDLGSEACTADLQAAEALFPLANARMLSVIQRGPVGDEYFRTISRALGSARLYESRIITDLDEVDRPDLTGEVADMLLRHQNAQWVLSYGFHDGSALVSLRTSQTERKAGDLMRDIVKGIGTGGGHTTSAGAQLPLPEGDKGARRKVVRKLRDRFLTRTGGKARGRRIVPRS